jgi:hypothetical protein
VDKIPDYISRGSGLDSRHYPILREVVGSLVRINEELIRIVVAPV